MHAAALASAVLALASLSLAQPATGPTQPADGAPSTTTPAEKPADDGLDPAVRRDTKHYNLPKDKAKPAISGYDPVAYFPEGGGKPAKGDQKFAFTYRGVTYWFASQKNLDAFKKSPRKFEPAYGGWCAYAMGATGEKVEIDPGSFKITGGRLFLFYKDIFTDTRSKWAKDEPALGAKADENWRKTSGEQAPTKPGGR